MSRLLKLVKGGIVRNRERPVAACEVICEIGGRIPVRAMDAIHLAACRSYGLAPLATTDRVMRRAAKALPLRVVPIR